MNRHLLIISVGRLSQMLIMFLTYRVLSSILSVPDMGVYFFLLSISAAFGLIYANPIGMYANRMQHSWRENGVLLSNFKTIILSFLVGSLLTIPLLFFFKQKISLEHGQWPLVAGTLVLYVFSTSINGTLVPSLNILGFTNHFVIWTLLTNLVGLILSYLLVTYVSPQPLYWLIGQGISFVFFGVVAYLVLYKNIKENSNRPRAKINDRIKRVARFALPILFTNIAVWILGQSFRFFYKEKVDPTILGELAFGLGLATSLSVAIEYLFQQLYLPGFYSEINDPLKDNGVVWNKLLNKLVPSYIYFIFFLIGLSPFLMRVLADVKFKNSGHYLALGACVEFLRMLGNTLTMATHSEMKTHKTIGPYLSGGLVTLIGVLYIGHYPEYVKLTPFCLMAGYLTASILLAINVRKMIKIKLNLADLGKSFLSSFVFLAALSMSRFSGKLFFSIGINFVFGLFLLFLFYQSYLKQKKAIEI
ncbi:MAG: lipopolysaccharide biosynthesis protein [Bacteriovorax sp.]